MSKKIFLKKVLRKDILDLRACVPSCHFCYFEPCKENITTEKYNCKTLNCIEEDCLYILQKIHYK